MFCFTASDPVARNRILFVEGNLPSKKIMFVSFQMNQQMSVAISMFDLFCKDQICKHSLIEPPFQPFASFKLCLASSQIETVKGKLKNTCWLDSSFDLHKQQILGPNQPLLYRFFHVRILSSSNSHKKSLSFKGQLHFHKWILHSSAFHDQNLFERVL